MKEKGVHVGNISELRCAIFVSSVRVSDCCVMEIFHDLSEGLLQENIRRAFQNVRL
jgi:hypothetical protein